LIGFEKRAKVVLVVDARDGSARGPEQESDAMAHTEVVQEGRHRRTAAAAVISTKVQTALVAQALRLLARNADRMHFSEGREEWDRLGVRNGRIWHAVARFGIDEQVLAGLRDRHGKLPPAVRNWRRARLAAEAEST
jgi:hypothetical protein